MKYRAANTQIKEIPIVFRGKIDGAGAGTDPTLEVTVNATAQTEYVAYAIIELSDVPDTLYCRVDGVYKELDNKTKITSGVYYYGAPIDLSYNVDFSEYPFGIMTSSMQTMIYFPDAGEKNVEIWYTEPVFPSPVKKVFEADLTGNGQVKRFHVHFALGENGTLRVKPYIILNGNIRVDLCNFASNGENYLAGDNEEISFDCFVPIETHAIAYVECENVGEYESILDAAIVVQYEDFIEPESIVGYEGINLRRK